MAGTGEIYRRGDSKWAFRVRASNGAIVAVDGSQGYSNKADARAVLTTLMGGGYDGPVKEQ